MHSPDTHPVEHVNPHPPQLASSVFAFTHRPPHRVSPPVHTQAALSHRAPIAVQSAQTPSLPHAGSRLPAVHVPPVAAEQQPPWQGWVAVQAVEQTPVAGSQASPAGQS
jgi:hypothetical protein